MSFKIYIDSRVSFLFLIPPTRKDFPLQTQQEMKNTSKEFCMDLFCLFQRDYMNAVQASVQKGLIGQSLEDFQQDVLSIETGLFYLKFVHFLKLFFYKLKTPKKKVRKYLVQYACFGSGFIFVSFFYSIMNFLQEFDQCVLLASRSIGVFFSCIFICLEVTCQIITSSLHIFFICAIFTRQIFFLQLGNICVSSIFVALAFLSL